MNPQCGYYQNGKNQGQLVYPENRRTCHTPQYQPGAINQGRVCRTRSTYGYNQNQASARAPPVFPSSSSANMYGNQSNNRNQYQQQRCWSGNGNNSRAPLPRSGRTIQSIMPVSQRGGQNCKLPYRQQEFECDSTRQQHPLAPAPYCTPQAIKVNVTAEMLENAKNKPIMPDRGENSQEDNPNAKYIQLNWQDLLGGMENLRVSMVPSSDPNCENRQLKVSFGGQKTDPPHAGETSLKVVSIEPVNTGRMDLTQGNALAGHMKICGNPTNLRMTPTNMNNNNSQQRQMQGQNSNYSGGYNSQYSQQNRTGGYGGGGAACRR